MDSTRVTTDERLLDTANPKEFRPTRGKIVPNLKRFSIEE